MVKKHDTYAVIMAGGGGTRFWPWSRERRPKQVLPVLSDRAMIWDTVERIRPLIPRQRIFIVTAQSQIADLRKEAPQIPADNLLAEPMGRNTAPCLCLAALHVLRKDPNGIMVVLPADHYIGNHRGFRKTLETAVTFARKQDYLITLGVRPTEPETGYGYIERGDSLANVGKVAIRAVKSFREKPTRAKAQAYLRTGKYFWNSGMFIWRASVFREAVKEFLPDLHRPMENLEKSMGTSREKRTLQKAYGECPSISVDYGIMEKAKNVALIEAGFSWSDVGSWAALGKIRSRDKDGNAKILCPRTKRGQVVLLDSAGCVVRSEEKLIAVIGLKDTVVVEAGNAVLVCPRDRSQDVRRVLKELQDRDLKEYL